MDAVSERQVASLVARDVEAVRLGVLRRVVVGSADNGQHDLAGLELVPWKSMSVFITRDVICAGPS